MPHLWVTPEELDESSRSPYAYEACQIASFVLWAYSGRKYAGTQTVTERYDCPCRSVPRPSIRNIQDGLFDVEPFMSGGAITNEFTGDCGCQGRHRRLRLRGRPVRAVQRVVSGGVTVDPDKYQVVNFQYLQAAPGASLDLCGVEVTYTYGSEPPTAGRRAARHLAQELAKGLNGEECELPDRVTSVSRQGVSYTILDEQSFLDDLRTGIYAVDLFLRAVNPDKARKPARVFSPDLPRVTRVTTRVETPASPLDLAVVPGMPATWTVPLTTINAGILTQPDWEPSGQISTWNGATLLEFDAARFTVAGGSITVSLTAQETGTIQISGNATWDLYAMHSTDMTSVVHLLTSNVRLLEQQATLI